VSSSAYICNTTKKETEMLKKDLIEKVKDLESMLEVEQSRPTGASYNTISDVHIDMGNDETGLAIAEAVKEGMKALQSITSQNKYGICFK